MTKGQFRRSHAFFASLPGAALEFDYRSGGVLDIVPYPTESTPVSEDIKIEIAVTVIKDGKRIATVPFVERAIDDDGKMGEPQLFYRLEGWSNLNTSSNSGHSVAVVGSGNGD